MLSLFDGATPDEIHLSKLSLWLSSQKGAEASATKVKDVTEVCRSAVEEALQAAAESLAVPLPTDVTSALRNEGYKANDLFTYFDYNECLESIAKAAGPKGEKNIFSAFTEPCLVKVSAALNKWEEGNLNLISGSEILTKLVLMTYPSSKRTAEKLHSRSDELGRLISEHERLATTYNKRYKGLCEKWKVHVESEGVTKHDNSVAVYDLENIRCDSKEMTEAITRQLETIASAAYRKSVFETKILAQINSPEFVECFLKYHDYLQFLDNKLNSDNLSSLNGLPQLLMAVRFGNCLTETQEARLYHPASTRQRKGSFESGGSGDDWTHVSAPEGSTDSKGEPTKILSPDDFCQQINSPLGRDVILKEIITLKGFFLSQSHLQGRKGNCKIDVGYAPPDVTSVSSALSSIQAVLDGFASEEFLNMLSLENNDAYLKRVRDEIVLNYNKAALFGGMADREIQEKANTKEKLSKIKSDLVALQANISFLKSSLEVSLKAKFGSVNIVCSELAGFA